MVPNGSEPSAGPLKDAIVKKWGSVANFLTDFSTQAGANFGSGWTWLAKSGDAV
jgi:Fe-Mn family superoxide dismutase